MNLSKSSRWFSPQDLPASVGVFLVAVPLSIGIAIASGAPPSAGLIAAVVGGLMVGLISGAPLLVSGPAAGLTALVLAIVAQYGLAGLACVTVLCGLLQIAFGAVGISKVFTWVPKAVLNGMLAAIGLIILASQFHIMVGNPNPPKLFGDAVQALPSTMVSLFSFSNSAVTMAAFAGLVALITQLVWSRFKKLSFIPGSLPAVFLATLVCLQSDVARVQLASLFDGTMAAISHVTSYDTWYLWREFLILAIGLALVASAETLLTARAVDSLADNAGLKDREPTNLNRELVAQGAGNFLSGLLGGLPITGVIVRSAANITFGAKTRMSTIMHGVWVLGFCVLFPMVIEKIPMAALASILVLTGVKLLNLKGVWAQFKAKEFKEVSMWLVTVGAIVLTDLLVGLGVGLGYAIALNGKRVYRYARFVFATRIIQSGS